MHVIKNIRNDHAKESAYYAGATYPIRYTSNLHPRRAKTRAIDARCFGSFVYCSAS